MGRLLLLEEEPNIAAIVLAKLRREGHEVDWEDDLSPEHALLAARRAPYDLILADLDGGHEPVAAALAPGWPVLALVAGTDPGSQDRARAAGAGQVVVKPFKPTVLARIVAGLTERPGIARGRVAPGE